MHVSVQVFTFLYIKALIVFSKFGLDYGMLYQKISYLNIVDEVFFD